MKNLLYIFTLLVVAGSVSCKKEQPEMKPFNEDCSCANEVSADFLMEEMTFSNLSIAKYTDTDSILGSKSVRFRVKESGAEYKWYIGSETMIDTSVIRFFGPSILGQTVPIILVVKKKPNKICFPNDDGYDSVVKYLTITNYPIADYVNHDLTIGSIEGTYRVKSAHLTDSFDVHVDCVIDNLNNQKLNLYNYDGIGSDCILTIQMEDGINYRELFVVGGTGTFVCDYIRGTIKHPQNGKVQMDFTLLYEGHPDYKILKYFGRKLN